MGTTLLKGLVIMVVGFLTSWLLDASGAEAYLITMSLFILTKD